MFNNIGIVKDYLWDLDKRFSKNEKEESIILLAKHVLVIYKDKNATIKTPQKKQYKRQDNEILECY